MSVGWRHVARAGSALMIRDHLGWWVLWAHRGLRLILLRWDRTSNQTE